jgi:periplasmic copper chaperone A
MKKILSISVLLVLFGGLLVACGSDSDSDDVTVSDVWTRVTAPDATTGAVYASLEASSDNQLTGASVPSDVAGTTELHETTHSGDMSTDEDSMSGEDMESGSSDGAMMGMKPVSSIDLPAGEEVNLEPGGYHIMLLDLAKPIEDGDTVPVTLTFESGDEMTVDATAREG